VLDIRKILLSSSQKTQKKEEKFSLVGEMDGKGNIVFHRHYLNNPTKKTKAIKVSAKDFLGSENKNTIKDYKANHHTKKIKKSCLKQTTKK